MLDSFSGYYFSWKCLICGNSSVVEHNLAKVGVASSSLVSRSNCISGFLKYQYIFIILQNGGVAEWLCSGLQSRVQRFDSAPRLHPHYLGIFRGCYGFLTILCGKYVACYSETLFTVSSIMIIYKISIILN